MPRDDAEISETCLHLRTAAGDRRNLYSMVGGWRSSRARRYAMGLEIRLGTGACACRGGIYGGCDLRRINLELERGEMVGGNNPDRSGNGLGYLLLCLAGREHREWRRPGKHAVAALPGAETDSADILRRGAAK